MHLSPSLLDECAHSLYLTFFINFIFHTCFIIFHKQTSDALRKWEKVGRVTPRATHGEPGAADVLRKTSLKRPSPSSNNYVIVENCVKYIKITFYAYISLFVSDQFLGQIYNGNGIQSTTAQLKHSGAQCPETNGRFPTGQCDR